MRKAEYSDFCIFAKFKTHFIQYFPKIRDLFRQNCIFVKHETNKNVRF